MFPTLKQMVNELVAGVITAVGAAIARVFQPEQVWRKNELIDVKVAGVPSTTADRIAEELKYLAWAAGASADTEKVYAGGARKVPDITVTLWVSEMEGDRSVPLPPRTSSMEEAGSIATVPMVNVTCAEISARFLIEASRLRFSDGIERSVRFPDWVFGQDKAERRVAEKIFEHLKVMT